MSNDVFYVVDGDDKILDVCKEAEEAELQARNRIAEGYDGVRVVSGDTEHPT